MIIKNKGNSVKKDYIKNIESTMENLVSHDEKENDPRDEIIKKNESNLNNKIHFNNSIKEVINKMIVQTLLNKQIAKSKRGNVLKMNPGIFKGWKEKYLIVENKELRYYESLRSDLCRPRGVINFEFLKFDLISEPNDSVFTLKIHNVNKEFQFKVNSIEERDEWIRVIQNNFEKCKNPGSKQNEIVAIPKYWKFSMVNYVDVISNCESGDIVLFQTKNFGAQVQRMFTGSTYDHVGFIVKIKNFDFFIFEATGNRGVYGTRWSHFLSRNWQNLYEHISFRKLICERDNLFFQKLQDFVKLNQGKKYSISVGKLLKKESESINNEGTITKDNYFCSELVGSFLKNQGFIKNSISSSSFWPGDFSEEKEIKLENGAKLGRQYKIIF